MRTFRPISALMALATALALSGAAIGATLAQSAGADVALGGFASSGGVAESGDTTFTFAGTEFAPLEPDLGATVLAGLAVALLCFEDGDGLSADREEAAGTDPCSADSDGDGLVDGADVEFIQSAVTALPASAFQGRSASGLPTAIHSVLDAIERHLLADDDRRALRQIEDLRRRVDGCASASGRADPNDWIVDCSSQLAIRGDLDLLAENVAR